MANSNTTVSPAIAALNGAGQSIWYDNLSRDVLDTGDLKSFIEQGVSGLTSNPTIFRKAILETDKYDTDITALGKTGKTTDEVCEALFIKDVGAAADLLRGVYDKSGGADGHASIEVSPLIASDTKNTVEAGRRIWKSLNRPNIMIKVPATPEGIPAIQQLIADGINVNVTLIFSVDVYEKVIGAYLSGLEDRVQKGLSIKDISSVASFFVSRVDSIVEKKIGSNAAALEEFTGKIGIANSQIAYELFMKKFSKESFKNLSEKGGRVQRPLWASTGTKNPKFSPVMYVEALAGNQTVNTVPPQTLDAILKGVKVSATVEKGIPEAHKILAKLAESGVKLRDLLQELQVEGVKSFSDAYKELVESIDQKLAKA